jgi:hypothetical protein
VDRRGDGQWLRISATLVSAPKHGPPFDSLADRDHLIALWHHGARRSAANNVEQRWRHGVVGYRWGSGTATLSSPALGPPLAMNDLLHASGALGRGVGRRASEPQEPGRHIFLVSHGSSVGPEATAGGRC